MVDNRLRHLLCECTPKIDTDKCPKDEKMRVYASVRPLPFEDIEYLAHMWCFVYFGTTELTVKIIEKSSEKRLKK